MNQELFSNADHIINRIFELLKKEHALLSQQLGGVQLKSDLSQGVIKQGGIYLPYHAIEYRLTFDGFQAVFLQSFIALYENVIRDRENMFTELAIRLLLELGFERTQILFGTSITIDARSKFKLHLMLADFAFQSDDNSSPQFQQFQRLFSDYRHLLTPKQITLYEDFIDCVKRNCTFLERSKLVKRMRMLSDTEQSSLYQKTPLDPLFNAPSLNAMFAAFSHMLHADAFVILNLFSSRRNPYQHTLRVYWVLVLCGFNVAKHVGAELNNTDINAELQSMEVDVAKIMQELRTFWEQTISL